MCRGPRGRGAAGDVLSGSCVVFHLIAGLECVMPPVVVGNGFLLFAGSSSDSPEVVIGSGSVAFFGEVTVT